MYIDSFFLKKHMGKNLPFFDAILTLISLLSALANFAHRFSNTFWMHCSGLGFGISESNSFDAGSDYGSIDGLVNILNNNAITHKNTFMLGTLALYFSANKFLWVAGSYILKFAPIQINNSSGIVAICGNSVEYEQWC